MYIYFTEWHNALFKKVKTHRNYIFEEAQRNGLVTQINFLNLCKRVYCIFKDFIHTSINSQTIEFIYLFVRLKFKKSDENLKKK